MKPTQKELTEWAVSKIEREYKDDVALLVAISGHSLDDDCHGECFDYFVPASEKGNGLARTFILGGVGHDLYPRSWERLENMARFDDEFASGLGEARILYARSEGDRARFAALQAKQKANMADKAFMARKALENLDAAMDIFRTLMFENDPSKAKTAAGFIARYLCVAIACLKGRYLKRRLELETVELAEMGDAPEGFLEGCEGIVREKTVEGLRLLSRSVITSTRNYLVERVPPRPAAARASVDEDLAGWYEEGSLTWRRIYRHCDAGNYRRAFADGLTLQRELNAVKAEFALAETDLLGAFDADDLSAFKDRALGLERYVRSEILRRGIEIREYATLEDFLAANG